MEPYQRLLHALAKLKGCHCRKPNKELTQKRFSKFHVDDGKYHRSGAEYRACKRKRRIASQRYAETVVKIMSEKYHKPFYWYHCDRCGAFHVSSMDAENIDAQTRHRYKKGRFS